MSNHMIGLVVVFLANSVWAQYTHELNLTYFDFRGRAEPTRLILAQAGVPYLDNRITHYKEDPEGWALIKPTTPYGQLPLLNFQGVEIAQSMAIARFVAKIYELTGKSAFEAAQCDEIVEAIGEATEKYYNAYFKQQENSNATIAEIQENVDTAENSATIAEIQENVDTAENNATIAEIQENVDIAENNATIAEIQENVDTAENNATTAEIQENMDSEEALFKDVVEDNSTLAEIQENVDMFENNATMAEIEENAESNANMTEILQEDVDTFENNATIAEIQENVDTAENNAAIVESSTTAAEVELSSITVDNSTSTPPKTPLQMKFDEETLPTLLKNLEKRLIGRGGQFMVANQLTWADIMVYYFCTELPDPTVVEQLTPHLHSLVLRVAGIDKIRSWVEKRPKSDF